MRKQLFGGGLFSAALASAATATGIIGALAARAAQQGDKVFGAENIQRYINSYGRTRDHRRTGSASVAQVNRHGGEHLHIRERARRLHPPGEARRAFIRAQQAT